MVRAKEREQLKKLTTNLELEARIIGCQIVQDKLITQLSDGREITISINLLTKWGVLDKEVKPEQLKKYELQDEGRYIYFPEIDDILPARIISEGLFRSCWER